ncbi:hydrogenase expression/formation protein HypE [Aquisalimonas sp.]|uniref:hydrogenase expression/formation protein HypE n=1 Tax=Aquisalimonas sp. TaxID=1872621 RepID=UPI0025BE03CF|nr:hydrogenase expression/formation protein HypE [Aquisalimonas sp.]
MLLAHGGGGRLMHRLLDELILPALGAESAGAHDAAVLEATEGRLAFTTDSFVVNPLFFPGGNIGHLAVHGTVNDLAMSGAIAKQLSVGLILEEGLPLADLWRILCSMREAGAAAGIRFVTGDTKVVDRGKGDGLFVNTSGLGVIADGVDIRPGRVQPGDTVIVSGDLGRHGMAIMASRERLSFETPIRSDSADLGTAVQTLLRAGIDVHCLRDLTRGGLASALHEIAVATRVGIRIEQARLPVAETVAGACEMLGLDPLYVACEGRFVTFVPAAQSDQALDVLHGHAVAEQATRIGEVIDTPRPPVTMTSSIGARRVIDMLSGEQLPRIC